MNERARSSELPYTVEAQSGEPMLRVLERLKQLRSQEHTQSVLLVLPPGEQEGWGNEDFGLLSDAQAEGTIPKIAAVAAPLGNAGVSGKTFAISHGILFMEHPPSAAQQEEQNEGEGDTSSSSQTHSFSTPPVRRSRRLLTLSFLLLALIVAVATAGAFFLQPRTPISLPAAAPTTVGHASFGSTAQGINDSVMVSTTPPLPPPPQGMFYAAWLLTGSSQSDRSFVYLGALQQGGARYTCSFQDKDHTNLLVNYSRVLITTEATNTAVSLSALGPTDSQAKYTGELPQSRPSTDGLTTKDHIDHLLADDPTLENAPVSLSNGLAVWFDHGANKIQENASAAVNANNDPELVHRAMVRILDYLDGPFRAQDVPSGTPLAIDVQSAKFGVYIGDSTTLSYFEHIQKHLAGIRDSQESTSEQKSAAATIHDEMGSVYTELKAVHDDAQALVKMSRAQLTSTNARTLLNDLAFHASRAYSGSTDPTTEREIAGVARLHAQMTQLSTIQLAACTLQTCPNAGA